MVPIKRLFVLKCSGILISARFVMAVAKCIFDINFLTDSVRITYTSNVLQYHILKVNLYGQYENNYPGPLSDIGLLLVSYTLEIKYFKFPTLVNWT